MSDSSDDDTISRQGTVAYGSINRNTNDNNDQEDDNTKTLVEACEQCGDVFFQFMNLSGMNYKKKKKMKKLKCPSSDGSKICSQCFNKNAADSSNNAKRSINNGDSRVNKKQKMMSPPLPADYYNMHAIGNDIIDNIALGDQRWDKERKELNAMVTSLKKELATAKATITKLQKRPTHKDLADLKKANEEAIKTAKLDVISSIFKPILDTVNHVGSPTNTEKALREHLKILLEVFLGSTAGNGFRINEILIACGIETSSRSNTITKESIKMTMLCIKTRINSWYQYN